MRFLPTRYVAPSRTAHDLSPLQQKLLQVLGDYGPIPLATVEHHLEYEDVSRRTVRRNLDMLRELGLAELTGHGRGARWRVM